MGRAEPGGKPAKPLIFMMGQSPAFFARDRSYTKTHYWAQPRQPGWRFGFTAFAVKLLGEVRTLQWSAQAGEDVTAGQPMGLIEGSKAVSDLFAPAGGIVLGFNPAVLEDPSRINSDLYEMAWLFDLQCAADGFLSPQDYMAHLEACWPMAQRMLKGQATSGKGHRRKGGSQ